MKVYNKHYRNAPPDAVYVGRPSLFGNPFDMDNMTRAEAVAAFEKYFRGNATLMSRAKEQLKGKDLVCFCSPLPCHADVLLVVANE